MPILPPKVDGGPASAPKLPPRPSMPRAESDASQDNQPATYSPYNDSSLDDPIQPSPAASPVPDEAEGDDLNNLTAELEGLGIESIPPPTSPAPAPAAPTPTKDTSPIPLREIRESGEPLDDIQFCPGSRAVAHSIKWHYMPAMADDAGTSLTCSRCYQDLIAPTPLVDEWSSEVLGQGKSIMCCFSLPRVKQVLWPEAVKSGSSFELRSFLAKIRSLQPCSGEKSITGVKGTTWYGLRDGDMPGFEACETCYEIYIAGTKFNENFAYFQEPAEQHTWTCWLRGETVGGIAAYMAEHNDWQGFVTAAFERLQLPTCAREPVQSDSCSWYLPNGSMGNSPICATCYKDSLARTPFANRFRPYLPQFDKFPSPGLWRCSLATLPSLLALEAALQRRDFDVFAEPMRNIVVAPPCTEKGIVDGQWWTLRGCPRFAVCYSCFAGIFWTRGLGDFLEAATAPEGEATIAEPMRNIVVAPPCTEKGIVDGQWWTLRGCPRFAVCYSCFAGIFWTRGLGDFLEAATAPEGEATMCSLHPTQPRFNQYWQKMYEAVDLGVFAYFADYVRQMSGIRVCGGNGGFPNSKWWGYPESYFCEDCYATHVKDTSLGEHLPLNGVVIEGATFCQIWSPRMRRYWQEVCEAGEPGSAESVTAIRNFRAFSKHRYNTYTKTLSEIELMRQLKGIQQRQAMFNGLMSVKYQGIHSMATLFSHGSGYQYGNSDIGYYDSSFGAESRILFGKFTDGLADSLFKPSEIQRILALQDMWKQVE